MHKVEFDQHCHIETLSIQTSNLVLNHPFEKTTWQAVGNELNAYSNFNPETFAGIIYHEDGTGPEKPYYNPGGDDWNPIVQAISRIGAQAQYWHAVVNNLKNLDFLDLISAHIIPVYPAGIGQIHIETNSYPFNLSMLAEKNGDTIIQHPKFIASVSCAGDKDFYGNNDNAIFPMRVRDSKGIFSAVSRKSLGLLETDVLTIRNSRNNLDLVYSSIFASKFKNLIVHLPHHQRELFNTKILQGEEFRQGSDVTRTLVLKDRSISDEEIDEFENTMKLFMKDEINNPVLQAAYQTHADGLTMLYETAKANHKDIYHY